MGRLPKVVACIGVAAGCAAAAAAGVAAALAVARPSAAPAIVCPLEPSQTVTTTCCGPPVVTAASARPAAIPCCYSCCVPTGSSRAQIACLALTASSSPNPSTAGQRVTISGQWSGGTAGQTVELWQELPRASSFSKVAQTTTVSGGQYQFVRAGIETNREWYVTVGAARSPTIQQQVRALVTLSRSLLVHVSPNHAGETVLMERRTKRGWKVLARLRLGSSPAVRVQKGATVRLRAVFPGDKRNVRSVSNVVVLAG